MEPSIFIPLGSDGSDRILKRDFRRGHLPERIRQSCCRLAEKSSSREFQLLRV